MVQIQDSKTDTLTPQEAKDLIILTAKRMFERRLTDMSGGNISVRVGDTVYMTATYSGAQKHWQIDESDIISDNVHTDGLIKHPRFSREGHSHLGIYRAFPDVRGIIHAHPFHVLPFCAAGRSIEPVLEGTQKFGVIENVRKAPAHTVQLAESVLEGLQGKDAMIRKQAAAVLLPQHGILIAGKDLLAALDALERIDWNAYCVLARSALPPLPVHV